MSNCYECKYRRNIPGDCHSSCSRLWAKGDSPRFDSHGIKNGWVIFPYNFDPTWLLECNGFIPSNPILTKKEEYVLRSLKHNYNVNKELNGGWTSPTEIGREYRYFVLGKMGGHSSIGTPVCKSLVAKGLVERNEKGKYRYKV